MDLATVDRVLRLQDGVISRRQALACRPRRQRPRATAAPPRAGAVVHPGVYVDHTGPPTWIAASLGRRALPLARRRSPGPSALRAHGLRSLCGPRRPVQAAVTTASIARRGAPRTGPRRHGAEPARRATVRRDRDASNRLRRRVQLHLSPPRLRLDEALSTSPSACCDEADAVALLADACQTGADDSRSPARHAVCARSTAPAAPAARRSSTMSRELDVGRLERRYLRDVERRTACRPARRQRRVVDEAGRDVPRRGVLATSGRRRRARRAARPLGRPSASGPTSSATSSRAARGGDRPARAGATSSNPVAGSCVVGRLLRSRGWTGEPQPCGRCPLTQSLVDVERPERDWSGDGGGFFRHRMPAIHRTRLPVA